MFLGELAANGILPRGPAALPPHPGSPAPCEHPESKVRKHAVLPNPTPPRPSREALTQDTRGFAGDGEARVFSLKFKADQEDGRL